MERGREGAGRKNFEKDSRLAWREVFHFLINFLKYIYVHIYIHLFNTMDRGHRLLTTAAVSLPVRAITFTFPPTTSYRSSPGLCYPRSSHLC